MISIVLRRKKRTLRRTSGEYCETFHQLLLASEAKSNLRTRTNLGTEAHLKRIGRSSCVIVLKNLGFTTITLPIPEHVLAAHNATVDIDDYEN